MRLLPLSAFPLLAFLALLHLGQARQGNKPRDKLQLRAKPRAQEVETNGEEAFDGLPADHEYEVDLSDQEERLVKKGVAAGVSSGEDPEPGSSSALSRSLEWLRKLMMGEDLADRLDDLICAWDKVVGTDLDTIVVLLLGWLGFGGVIFVVSHFIYSTIGKDEVHQQVSAPSPIPPYQPNAEHIPPPRSNYSVPLNGIAAGASSGRISPAPPSNLPQAVGSDQETVDYVNKCWKFIYSNPSVRADIQAIWMEKLNEFAKRSALDDGLLVEFLEILGESDVPIFSNMTADNLPDDNMTISCDISASISFLLRTSRPIRESMATTEFLLHVDRLRGRFSITVISSEHLVIAKLEGWPDIKMRLSKSGGLQSHHADKEEQNLADVVEEVSAQAIRGVQLDLKTDTLKNFPVFVRKVAPDSKTTSKKLSNPNFSRGGTRPNSSPAPAVNGIGSGPVHTSRQLDVKIVKAVQLGGTSGRCLEPYVVLEVDEPSQRKQTRTGSGAQFAWEEAFSIEITVHSSELLFEVWDQGQKIGKSDAFMGLGIVAVAELMVTASQRHVIPLQGRPYEEDQVTGLLTIEFLFKDGGLSFEEAETVPGVHRTFEAASSQSYMGGNVMNKKTVYSRKEPNVPEVKAQNGQTPGDPKRTPDGSKRSAEGTAGGKAPEGLVECTKVTRKESYLRATRNPGQDLLNGADVADMALRDIQINRSRGSEQQPSKSTLTIHQVQRPHRSSSRSTQERPGSSTSNELSRDEGSESIGTASITSKDSDIPAPYRRGRLKKRNLISSIKKRFTGTRSLSSGLDPNEKPQGFISNTNGDSRQTSLDRVRSVSEHRPENLSHPSRSDSTSNSDSGCSLTLASWRGSVSLSWQSTSKLHVPMADDASSMSDVSNISSFSQTSNKTFVTEESSLVLETLEEGRHHHYLIPIQAARRGRFKKKGTKLHIFMDHIFVARHIKLGSACQVCNVLIPLRLGKQAYVCRDCGLTCHKPCHIRVDNHCLQTSLPNMELEFYSEDPAA